MFLKVVVASKAPKRQTKTSGLWFGTFRMWETFVLGIQHKQTPTRVLLIDFPCQTGLETYTGGEMAMNPSYNVGLFWTSLGIFKSSHEMLEDSQTIDYRPTLHSLLSDVILIYPEQQF